MTEKDRPFRDVPFVTLFVTDQMRWKPATIQPANPLLPMIRKLYLSEGAEIEGQAELPDGQTLVILRRP